MPRYLVTEKRAYTETTLIEAEDEAAARQYDGNVLDSSATDSYGDELLGVEEASADAEIVE